MTSEREKGPGPTLPAEIWAHRWWHTLRDPANGGVMAATSFAGAVAQREETFRFGEDHPLGASEVARYVLAPDPERQKLVADVLADALGAAMAWRQGDGVTQERRLEDLDLSTRRLEAHDAKGEAGT